LAGGSVSRILSSARSACGGAARHGDHSSRSGIPPGLKRPTRGSNGPGRPVPAGRQASLLFGLAPRGVCRASGVTTGPVGSYPTFSPLPDTNEGVGPAEGFASDQPSGPLQSRRYIFCGTFRGSPRPFGRIEPPGVTRRVALRSPDFPPRRRDPERFMRRGDRPTNPPHPL